MISPLAGLRRVEPKLVYLMFSDMRIDSLACRSQGFLWQRKAQQLMTFVLGSAASACLQGSRAALCILNAWQKKVKNQFTSAYQRILNIALK